MQIRKNVRWICLLTLAVVCTFLYKDLAFRLLQPSKLPMKNFKLEERKPLILAWTAYFEESMFSEDILQSLNCEISPCTLSTDRKFANFADALIFHWRNTDVQDIPVIKPWHQKWVLLNYESPYHSPKFFPERFDWTVSYKLDSDFVSLYGNIRKRRDTDPPEQSITEHDFQNKKVAAWMVSNCNSKSERENLFRKLQKYLQVDVYGGCAHQFNSTYSSIKGNRYKAYNFLAKRYKFYLAFENSLCTDYVTEKAFYPLLVGMVPVVFGLANYSKILPPGSFINSLQFKTVSELSEYLLQLSKNFTQYKEYLKWRKNFSIDRAEVSGNYLCELCLRLRENKRSSTATRDIRSWWDVERNCK